MDNQEINLFSLFNHQKSFIFVLYSNHGVNLSPNTSPSDMSLEGMPGISSITECQPLLPVIILSLITSSL